MSDNNNSDIQVCYKHPDHATLLRCNQCDRPICLECAVSTPTGYRCKECVKKQQKRFNTSVSKDYLTSGVIAAVIGLVGSLLQSNIHIFPFFLTIILGPVLGKLIVTLVRRACSGRRSDILNKVTVISAGIGAALPSLHFAISVLQAIFLGKFNMLLSLSMQLGWSALFIALLCGTIWAELKGINFKGF